MHASAQGDAHRWRPRQTLKEAAGVAGSRQQLLTTGAASQKDIRTAIVNRPLEQTSPDKRTPTAMLATQIDLNSSLSCGTAVSPSRPEAVVSRTLRQSKHIPPGL